MRIQLVIGFVDLFKGTLGKKRGGSAAECNLGFLKVSL